MNDLEKEIQDKRTFFIKRSAAEWVAISLTLIIFLVATVQYADTKPSRDEVNRIVKEKTEQRDEIINLKLDAIKIQLDILMKR